VISPQTASASSLEGGPADEIRRWIIAATIAAAGAELLILRVFTRTAIHIPGFADLRMIYVPVSEAGRSAYYVAVVLLTATLVLTVEDLRRRSAIAARLGAAGIALFLVVVVMARVGAVDALTLDAASLAAVLLVAPWTLGALDGRSWIPGVLLMMAFMLSGVGAVTQVLAGSGWMLGGDTRLMFGAEVLALGAAITAPMLVGPVRSLSAFAWGAFLGATTYAGLLVNASTVKILLLWNFGLAGYLPSVLYGIAAGSAAYTVLALRATGRRTSALGLALVLMGGIGLHSTYQTGLVLAGFALLGTADRSPGAPSLAADARGV
jgi:hypothetical protein